MNLYEAIVITAYTTYNMVSGEYYDKFLDYVEYKLGRRYSALDLMRPELAKALHDTSKTDLMDILLDIKDMDMPFSLEDKANPDEIESEYAEEQEERPNMDDLPGDLRDLVENMMSGNLNFDPESISGINPDVIDADFMEETVEEVDSNTEETEGE